MPRSRQARPNPVGKVLAAVIFLVVAYAIVSGIVYVIATGKGATTTSPSAT